MRKFLLVNGVRVYIFTLTADYICHTLFAQTGTSVNYNLGLKRKYSVFAYPRNYYLVTLNILVQFQTKRMHLTTI